MQNDTAAQRLNTLYLGGRVVFLGFRLHFCREVSGILHNAVQHRL
jgi:hypothetical protein